MALYARTTSFFSKPALSQVLFRLRDWVCCLVCVVQFCLQPHIYRCLLRAMDDGLVRPYAVEPLRRYVASLGALPPLFSAGPSAPSLFYPFVQPSLSENNVNNSEEDLKMSAAATSPGQNRTKALSSAAAVASLPSQSRKTSKGVSGGDEEERASGADGRGKTGASPGEGGEDKVESYLVDVSSSQSCSRGPCSAAAAAGVGTSMTYADHLHGSGAAGMREGGGSGLPDLPTDPDLAMILVLEIDFQDTKSPPNLMLSFKKTLTQEKVGPSLCDVVHPGSTLAYVSAVCTVDTCQPAQR